MFIQEVIKGLIKHKEFIFFNDVIHIIAGISFATALFPFLSKKLKNKFEYFTVVFFPAVFGSMFPDLMFICSTLFEHRSIDGLFLELSNGGHVYSSFHFSFPIILVIPTTVFLMLIFTKAVRGKFDELPGWSILWMSLVALFCALLHIFMDTIGF
jgi:hypothetical protein